MSSGKKNAYSCKDGHMTVTIDLIDGTTPFMIRCRHPDCHLMAESWSCRVNQELPATHEWYRPTDKETRSLDEGKREHVSKGGLLLREIKPPGLKKRRGVRAQQQPRGRHR